MTFAQAAIAIAPYVDNGVNSGDTRIAARLNEAQRRLIDQYNFLVRREQYDAEIKTFVERTANSTNDLILDNYDATKVMVLAMWREENNELEMAAALEKKALDMVERDLMREVETARKTEFKGYETANNQNTFGGIVGRVGLETFEKYRSPAVRVASYVNQAIQMAVDHYNFLVRREELNESGTGGATELTFTARNISTATDRAIVLDSKIPVETIRLFTVSLMAMDSGGLEQSLQLKQAATALIERNVIAAVEKTRRAEFTTLSASNQQTFGGLTGRIGLETVARYRLSEARIKSYINQAYQSAVDHYNFITRRETLDAEVITFSPLSSNTDTFHASVPSEVVRLIVLSYIESDNSIPEPRQN